MYCQSEWNYEGLFSLVSLSLEERDNYTSCQETAEQGDLSKYTSSWKKIGGGERGWLSPPLDPRIDMREHVHV